MEEKLTIEPFRAFAEFMTRYAISEGFMNEPFVPASHLCHVRAAARELGVIYHDDGSLELIRQ